MSKRKVSKSIDASIAQLHHRLSDTSEEVLSCIKVIGHYMSPGAASRSGDEVTAAMNAWVECERHLAYCIELLSQGR
jgi:hypothetical protein